MSLFKCFAALLLLALLGGCASTLSPPVHDPAFAPSLPPPQVAPSGENAGGLFQPERSMFLYQDVRARSVGDLLTILLIEETDASKSSSTSTSKDQSVGIEAGVLFGRTPTRSGVPILETNLGANRDFGGQGSTSQSNRIQGSITVTVAEVLANGNLLVQGEKVMSLNEGDEFVRFSGIVRPTDITPGNMVESTRVANSRIVYGGRGPIAESNRMGWLGRFFNSPAWPF